MKFIKQIFTREKWRVLTFAHLVGPKGVRLARQAWQDYFMEDVTLYSHLIYVELQDFFFFKSHISGYALPTRYGKTTLCRM